MEDFKQNELETIIRPTYRAMESRINDFVYHEVNSLGLGQYMNLKTYVSLDDECSAGKYPGRIYLLNIDSVTIRIGFGFDELRNEFTLYELLIETPNQKLEIHTQGRSLFELFSMGFFKPIVKIWLDINSGKFEDFLYELNRIDGISVWTQTHIEKITYPQLYLPLFVDGRLISKPGVDKKSAN